MKDNKINIIIILLSGIIIGLLVAFIAVVVLKGNSNENNETNEEIETKSIEYNDPVDYFEEINNSNDESKLKKGFTTIIDFLFYDKDIKGKTLSDITDESKLKIMEIALTLDQKVDSKFPNYKDKISDKYQNIKAKIVELYINTVTKLCDSHEQLCIDAKNDFNSLKENFGLTFDKIKEYGVKGLDKLKEWYEDYRD